MSTTKTHFVRQLENAMAGLRTVPRVEARGETGAVIDARELLESTAQGGAGYVEQIIRAECVRQFRRSRQRVMLAPDVAGTGLYVAQLLDSDQFDALCLRYAAMATELSEAHTGLLSARTAGDLGQWARLSQRATVLALDVDNAAYVVRAVLGLRAWHHVYSTETTPAVCVGVDWQGRVLYAPSTDLLPDLDFEPWDRSLQAAS